MKKLLIPTAMLAILFTSGCVQTQFIKTIQVNKDASGKVIGTVETESVVQPGSAMPLSFKHLNKDSL